MASSTWCGSIVGPVREGVHVCCCGPTPMLDALTSAAASWPAGHVHLEHFSERRYAFAAARSFAAAGTGLKVRATATAASPTANEPM